MFNSWRPERRQTIVEALTDDYRARLLSVFYIYRVPRDAVFLEGWLNDVNMNYYGGPWSTIQLLQPTPHSEHLQQREILEWLTRETSEVDVEGRLHCVKSNPADAG